MGEMAQRGINFMMPYSFSPFARHGMTRDLPGGRAGATAIREKLVLSYFDEAAKHGVKLLFDCAGLYIDQGDKAYTNETLKMLTESIRLVVRYARLGLSALPCDISSKRAPQPGNQRRPALQLASSCD